MPQFEYRCERCGGYTTRIRKNNKADAPKCCGQHMTKVTTAPAAFIFKGTGFYANDYGKGQA